MGAYRAVLRRLRGARDRRRSSGGNRRVKEHGSDRRRSAKAIDIRFPCGGGVDVLVHPVSDPEPLRAAPIIIAQYSASREPVLIVMTRASACDETLDLRKQQKWDRKWQSTENQVSHNS